MKLLISILLFSAGASAATHIEHNYQVALNGLPLANVCVTATTIQTIRPVKVCTDKREVKVEHDGQTSADYVCIKWNNQNISYPRNGLPASIPVRTWTENGDSNNFPGVQSTYTFPICD